MNTVIPGGVLGCVHSVFWKVKAHEAVWVCVICDPLACGHTGTSFCIRDLRADVVDIAGQEPGLGDNICGIGGIVARIAGAHTARGGEVVVEQIVSVDVGRVVGGYFAFEYVVCAWVRSQKTRIRR